MYQISKIFRFEAAHHLPNHDGKCQRVHGHSWVATVTVACPRLVRQGSKQGMVMDFGDLKAVVQPIIDQYLDHWDLNETIPVYPTSENIACWLFERITTTRTWAMLSGWSRWKSTRPAPRPVFTRKRRYENRVYRHSTAWVERV